MSREGNVNEFLNWKQNLRKRKAPLGSLEVERIMGLGQRGRGVAK